jgi:uncharacterized protein YaaQ
MKMVMAVISRDESERVLQALVAAGLTATFTESRGGMLRQAQNLLFAAVKEENLEQVLSIIDENCHSRVQVDPGEQEETHPLSFKRPSVVAQLGGAVVFVWDIERVETF